MKVEVYSEVKELPLNIFSLLKSNVSIQAYSQEFRGTITKIKAV
jgi:hypothetical protein